MPVTNLAQSPAPADAHSAESTALVPLGDAEAARPDITRATIALAQGGDHAAFELIVAHYETMISNYIYRLMRDRDDAVDLTQDTFLKAFLALPKTSDDLRVGPWLYRIATNACLDELRHRKLVKWTPWRVIWSGGVAQSKRHAGLFVSVDRLDSPDVTVLADEQQTEVGRVLDELHSKYRQVLVLREYHDLTYDEIAEVMTTTRAAVKSMLFRARSEFRVRWEYYQAHLTLGDGTPVAALA